MADIFSKKKRSEIMSQVRANGTQPELLVRALLKSLGFRPSRYDSGLPGKPDIVFRNRKKAIFVHGCFWHGHKECKRSKMPTSNKRFWYNKITGNIRRDQRVQRALRRSGWSVMVIWQCQLKDSGRVTARLRRFLDTELDFNGS